MGMIKAGVASAMLAVALGLHSGTTAAQQCGVFTDVQTTDSFCVATQWLRNRSITLGCTNTTYCPGSTVTRAQMALFMERLGRATSSTVLTASSGAGTLPPITTNQFATICSSTEVPPATFPRRAVIRGHAALTASGSVPMQMFLMYDDTPPGAWTNANGNPLVVPAPFNGFLPLSWGSDPVPIAANTPYRFAIGLSLLSGGSGSITGGAYRCHLEILFLHETGSSPPFDLGN